MQRKNEKFAMNRQVLGTPIFGMRKNKVKFPTFRKGYLTDEKVDKIKAHVMSKGRSIVFLDGPYETKLNRYVRADPNERAVFFEYMLRQKGTKGAIQSLCWLGSFHNGSIIHFAPQFPQWACWLEAGGMEAIEFFENGCFRIYRAVAEILYDGLDNITDKEVKAFIESGSKVVD